MDARGVASHSKNSRKLNAHIVLLDESGLMTAPLLRRSLAPRGKTPVIQQKGSGREKVSVIGALSISPRRQQLNLHFQTRVKGSYDNVAVAEFLRQLLRSLRGKIILVWDRAPFHRGPAIRELLSRTRRLWLEQLPPYAPDLNPVEPLWSWLKWGRFANYAAEGAVWIDLNLRKTLRGMHRSTKRLRSFFDASELPFPDEALAS